MSYEPSRMHGVPLPLIKELVGNISAAESWLLSSWEICRHNPATDILIPLDPHPWIITGSLLLPATSFGQVGALVLHYKPVANNPSYPTKATEFSGLYSVVGTDKSRLSTVQTVRVENDTDQILLTSEHRPSGVLQLLVATDGETLSGTFHNTNSLRPGRENIISRVAFSRSPHPYL